ncbi:MAG: cyclic nucleotide-binding domain-containing protein [Desulfovermiculus sp.]|nr:cyclic nucleotide-binding domain-containing protein [Desulfovermiculus sp.]
MSVDSTLHSHVDPLEDISPSRNMQGFALKQGVSRGQLGSYLLALGACKEKDILRGLRRQEEVLARNRYLPLGQILLEQQSINADQLQTALKQQTVDFLLAVSSYFEDLDRETVSELFACSEHIPFAQRTVVFRQGEPGQKMYVLLRGSVGLTHNQEDGGEIDIGLVRPGEIFGEIGPLTDSPHLVTARTLEPSTVLAVPVTFFFQGHVTQSQINQEILRKWFRSAVNGRIQTRLFHDYHYRELLSQLESRPCIPLLGSSRQTRRLREDLLELSSRSFPALLVGGSGTMKTRVAQYLHQNGPESNGPYIIFHPHRIPEFIRSLIPEDVDTLDLEEMLQLGVLFGFHESILPASQPPWHGFLQIAHNGTLVIAGVADLRSKVQRQLATYISTGVFYPLGSENPGQASVRMVIAADDDLELENDLYISLARSEVFLPPLSHRKRDLKEVATQLATHIGEEENKPIIGIDEGALNKIVAYDWPGNDRELEGVIQRGVTLAKTNQLSAEDVFISEEPMAGKPAFNLLGLSLVRRFFESHLYPRALRWGMTLMFFLIIVMGLWGQPSPESNISLLLVWANWEPLLILSCILLARIWCSMCPMGQVVDWFYKIPFPRLRIPERYHLYGYVISALGLGLIFWAQAAWDMWDNPVATSWLLVTITGTAALFALTLEGNIWCRYSCPLGLMVGTLARTSMVEVRSNLNYCANECQDYECYTGRNGISGCRMGKGPFTMQTNHDCILCANCIKACPHRSVRVNLRPPGWELWNVWKSDPAAMVFIPLLWGTQLFRSLVHADWGQPFVNVAGSTHLGLGLVMTVTILFAFIIGGIGVLTFGLAGVRGEQRFGPTFFLAGLPIVYAFEVALRLEPLLNQAADFFAVVGNQIGYDLPKVAFRLDLQSVAILQVVTLILGTVVAVFVAARQGQRLSIDHGWPGWIKHLPLLFMGGLSMVIL